MAQTTVLKGTARDEQGNLLDGATVELNQSAQPAVSRSTVKGVFIFQNLSAGKYTVKVSHTGYETLTREIIMPADTVVLILKQQNRDLKEVAVALKTPLIERKIDRVVFNVEKSIMAGGSNVWDVLTKAPGVQATFDGSIKVSGKGVVIYMDDKPIRLSGEDLATYLRNLPSDNISKIEILTNPTARYDAQGGAVINIISKKSKAQGLNTILNSAFTQSAHSSYNSSASFNYRKDKLNIYGNYGYGYRKKQKDETEYIIFETPSNYSYWDNDKKGVGKSNANNYRLGVDYSLTDKQVVGILMSGTNSTSARTNDVSTQIYNNHQTSIDSLLKTANTTSGNTNQYSYNLNYKAKIDTSGQSFNVDFDFTPYRNNGSQSVNNLSFLPDGSQASSPYRVLTFSRQKIDIWSGKADYTYAFSKKWNMEAGLKYSSIVTKNQFDFFNNAGAAPVIDSKKSDDFEYKENTSAAYTTLNGGFGKVNIQAGLRAEYTRTSGYSLTLDALNKNNYLRLFPTLFLTYALAKDHELNVNYNYRINRPEYWRLNPFKYYTSPYTYLEGNPALQPAFIHSAEIGYTYKQQYNASFYYRSTNGYFSNITVQDNVNKIFFDTQRNLDQSMQTGVSLSAPYNPADWLEINSFFDLSYKKEKSGYLTGNYDYHTLLLYMNTNLAFTISKKQDLKAEISGWYLSPTIQGIYKLDRMFDVSAGIRKKVLNKQGTIRLAVSDIFYSNTYRLNVNYLTQRNGFYEKSDTRNVTLGFSYNLGNTKIAGSRKRSTASEEEKKRTQ